MICVPIKKTTVDEVLVALRQAENEADILEIWFDEINDLSDENIPKIFKEKSKPIIYKWQGNKENLEKILNFNPEFLDLDISTSQEIIDHAKTKIIMGNIIISYHDFKITPSSAELEIIANQIISAGADILKIAAKANDFTDSLRMLEFLSKTSQRHKSICLCMGKEGKITRATGHLLGNYLMYAPINITDQTADGQLSVQELKSIQNIIK